MRLLALAALLSPAYSSDAADRPNILWLTAEDISPSLGCYGDPLAKTPTLDALAASGVRYDKAYTHAPVCAVVRSGVITGVYPVSIGTHHMRRRVDPPPHVRCFTEYLREAGYYCTNRSKEDYNFEPPETAWDASSNKAHWRNRPDDEQPFFAVFNHTGTHESRVRGDEPAYSKAIRPVPADDLVDSADVVVAPYHPDTPAVREVYAKLYNTVAALDLWVAEHLQQLEEAGVADDTIVVFWSDHGVSLPRGKRWLYESGVRVPLIVRVPEKWKPLADAPQESTDELVSSIDFAPTMLRLAGLGVPEHMQGRAFLGPDRGRERQSVFLHRDRMDERYDMSRAIVTKRYKYIRNFHHWRPWAQHLEYAERSPVLQEMRRLKAAGELTPAQAAWLADRKPVEELYDLEQDPDELTNLSADAAQAQRLAEFRKRVEDEMLKLRDLGIVPEGELARLEGQAGSQSRITQNIFDRESKMLFDYGGLLSMAAFVASPPPPPGDPIITVSLTGGAGETELAAGPTANVWGLRAFLRAAGSENWGRDGRESLLASLQIDPATLSPVARVAAAELCLHAGADAEGVALLSEALAQSDDDLTRLEAFTVLDLAGDLSPYASELFAAVARIRKEVDEGKVRAPGQRYLVRCSDRLEQCLAEK